MNIIDIVIVDEITDEALHMLALAVDDFVYGFFGLSAMVDQPITFSVGILTSEGAL